jgi:DNA polymerase-3 subunit delta'
MFARALAQCLFCREVPDEQLDACGACPDCKQVLSGSHPDLLTAGPPEGKSVFPIDVIAGPKERRGREGLCYDISLRPMMANRRIAIVDDVHLMNAEAANAFLKTLEEPPAYATLILITSNENALLPTIRSRCQPVRFAPLPPQDVSRILLDTGRLDDPAEADAVAALSEGSLETAGQLLDPELRKIRTALYDRLAARTDDPLGLAKLLVDEGVEQIGGDSHAQRQTATWLVRFLIEFYRRTVQSLSGMAPGTETPVERYAERLNADRPDHVEAVMALLDRCAEAERQLARNNPPRMVLETLSDDLCRRTRAVLQ